VPGNSRNEADKGEHAGNRADQMIEEPAVSKRIPKVCAKPRTTTPRMSTASAGKKMSSAQLAPRDGGMCGVDRRRIGFQSCFQSGRLDPLFYVVKHDAVFLRENDG
jgi:hypothetical protein